MPEPVHRASAAFWRCYEALPKEMQQRADKQFALLATDSQHPSLLFNKVGERHGREVYSARITLNYRALAIRQADGFLWFWIGDHRTYDSLIG